MTFKPDTKLKAADLNRAFSQKLGRAEADTIMRLAGEVVAASNKAESAAQRASTSQAAVDATVISAQVEAAQVSADAAGTAKQGAETARDAAQGFAGEAESARDATAVIKNETAAVRDAAQGYSDASLAHSNSASDYRDATELLKSDVSALALTVAGDKTAAQTAAASAAAVSGLSNLSEAARAIALSTSVVAVAMIGAAKDSDAGAWRDRVPHVSWMNEALATATRGTRSQIPGIAAVLATASLLSVHDEDDPAAPLWKSWTVAGLKSVTYLGNGMLAYAGTGGLYIIDFIADRVFQRTTTALNVCSNQNVATFNQSTATWAQLSSGGIAHATINSIATTVLPHTPPNPLRCGLPNPTVAVGTAQGLTVIRHDNRACSYVVAVSFLAVAFHGTNLIAARSNYAVYTIPPAIYLIHTWNVSYAPALFGFRSGYAKAVAAGKYVAMGSTLGMALQLPELTLPVGNYPDYPVSPIAYIDDKATSGLLANGTMQSLSAVGTIMALSESSVDLTSMVGSGELFTNGDFASTDVSDWVPANGATVEVVAGQLEVSSPTTAYSGVTKSFTGLEPGGWYYLAGTLVSGTGRITTPFANVVGSTYANQDHTGPKEISGVVQAHAVTGRIDVLLRTNAIGSTCVWDNFSLKKAPADRAAGGYHGGYGLYVVGTLPRSVVATGAELAAYGPFDASNYLTGKLPTGGVFYGWQEDSAGVWSFKSGAGLDGCSEVAGVATVGGTKRKTLIRYSTLPLPADQLKAIETAERPLFAANAKCLMIGSPNVQALAYDSDTDQIYAATAVGTNVFRGLARVGYQQSTTNVDLSQSNNHKHVAAIGGNVIVGTALGVDVFIPSIALREQLTARKPFAPYDPRVSVHRAVTYSATAADLLHVPVEEGKAYRFRAMVAAVQYGGTATERAAYVVEGLAWRDVGGNVQVSYTTTVLAEITAGMDCIAEVNATAQVFSIRGTGKAFTRIAWVTRLELDDLGLMGAA